MTHTITKTNHNFYKCVKSYVLNQFECAMSDSNDRIS